MKIYDLPYGLFKFDDKLFLKFKQHPSPWECTYGLFALELIEENQSLKVNRIFLSGECFQGDIIPIHMEFSCLKNKEEKITKFWKFSQLKQYELFAIYYQEYGRWSLDRETACILYNACDIFPNEVVSYAVDLMNGVFIMKKPDDHVSLKELWNTPVAKIGYMYLQELGIAKSRHLQHITKSAV